MLFFISTGKASCDLCTKGYYCPENTTDPTDYPCPGGHYCPDGTKYSSEYKCRAGYYNPQTTQTSQAACLLCTAGKYCEGEGLSSPTGNCSIGWFCSGGSVQDKPAVVGKGTDIICPTLFPIHEI